MDITASVLVLSLITPCLMVFAAEDDNMNSERDARAAQLDTGRLLLENSFLHLEIDPGKGGRVASFVDKRSGEERIRPGRLPGCAYDNIYEMDRMVYQGQWNVEQSAAYEGEITQAGGEVASVKVSRPTIMHEDRIYYENYDGMVIEREFILRKDEPVLQIKVRIRNEADEGKRPAYSMRNSYMLGKSRDEQQYIRPTQQGVVTGAPDDPNTEYMVWDPAYGWTATRNSASGEAVVWLMDASRLMMFYNCVAATTSRHVDEFINKWGVDPLWIWDNASAHLVSAEWYYRPIFIPTGQTFETTVTMVSLEQTSGISHACPYFIAHLNPPAPEVRGTLSVNLWAASQPLSGGKISAVVVDLADGSEQTLGESSIPALGTQAAAVSLHESYRQPANAVIRLRVAGTGADGGAVDERFEYLCAAAADDTGYRIPAPEPTFSYTPGTAEKPESERPRVLFVKGLAFERWRLMESLEKIGADVRQTEFMKRRVTTAVRYFPTTLEEALQYDIIILGAVDAWALAREGTLLLKDYVECGGSLLVLGGLYAYGAGRYQEMGLDELLPLRVNSTFDLQRGDGLTPVLTEIAEAGTPVELAGAVRWFHELEAAPDAAVLARIGEHPLAAVSVRGKGRIACIAATVLGGENIEPTPFWLIEGWSDLQAALLQWLLQE